MLENGHIDVYITRTKAFDFGYKISNQRGINDMKILILKIVEKKKKKKKKNVSRCKTFQVVSDTNDRFYQPDEDI